MIYTDETCSWCGKTDMCIDAKKDKSDLEYILICIPCMNDVYEDWKKESGLYLVK